MNEAERPGRLRQLSFVGQNNGEETTTPGKIPGDLHTVILEFSAEY